MKIINDNLINFKAKKMPPYVAQAIDLKLKSAKHVDIICHEASDRDSANSALAMWEYLKQNGIQSQIVINANMRDLKLRNEKADFIQADKMANYKNLDTVLCVDFSSKSRAPKKASKLIDNSQNVVCIDHHTNSNIDTNIKYIDTTALSATSIIYRYFEALGKDIDEDCAYDLFSGLISDCMKKNLVICDGNNGLIIPQMPLIENEEAYEVYLKLREKISDEKIQALARNLDIMSCLSNDEKKFYESLFDNAILANNEKIAYVELDVDDKTWKSLGGDNERTSKMLNTFRQSVLKSKYDRFKDVETVFCFYEAKGVYRLSVHSKKDLKYLYDALNSKHKNDPKYSFGGHANRGGGKVASINKKDCKNFVSEVITTAKALNY